MTRQNVFPRLPAPAGPRLLKRAALLTGGAVIGIAVSVASSYALVNALVPGSALPAAPAPQQPVASLAGFTVSDPGNEAPRSEGYAAYVVPGPAPARPSPLPRVEPVLAAVDPAALSPLPEQAPAAEMTLARAPVVDAPAVPPQVPAAPPQEILANAPGPGSVTATDLVEPVAPEELAALSVIAGRPDVVPPSRPAALVTAYLASVVGLPERALAHPPARPGSEASPEAFAALAATDAANRSGATLGFSGARPEARPETLAAADAATDDAATDTEEPTLSALVAASVQELPATRPLPRPAAAVVEAAFTVAQLDEVPSTIPGLRPEPRPELIRVASATPQAAPAPEAAEPEVAAPRTRVARGVCGRDLTRDMPRRRSGADTGSAFFAGLGGLSGTERDNRIISELGRGNMPDFLRELHPVRFTGQDSRGAATEIIVCVTPDYLALGSDRDFVRTPLGLPAASRIAGAFDMTLPTPRMVDAIYAQADVHLSPAPMTPGPQMSSTAYLLRHNDTIQQQLHGRGGLVAGQKKDLVMASRMASHPGKVAIYGWHRSNTSPIQPVSTVHQASYADYSHGIRLVSRTAFLNGRPVDLDDLLTSSRYAYLLNSDGPLPAPVIRIASR